MVKFTMTCSGNEYCVMHGNQQACHKQDREDGSQVNHFSLLLKAEPQTYGLFGTANTTLSCWDDGYNVIVYRARPTHVHNVLAPAIQVCM